MLAGSPGRLPQGSRSGEAATTDPEAASAAAVSPSPASTDPAPVLAADQNASIDGGGGGGAAAAAGGGAAGGPNDTKAERELVSSTRRGSVASHLWEVCAPCPSRLNREPLSLLASRFVVLMFTGDEAPSEGRRSLAVGGPRARRRAPHGRAGPRQNAPGHRADRGPRPDGPARHAHPDSVPGQHVRSARAHSLLSGLLPPALCRLAHAHTGLVCLRRRSRRASCAVRRVPCGVCAARRVAAWRTGRASSPVGWAAPCTS